MGNVNELFLKLAVCKQNRREGRWFIFVQADKILIHNPHIRSFARCKRIYQLFFVCFGIFLFICNISASYLTPVNDSVFVEYVFWNCSPHSKFCCLQRRFFCRKKGSEHESDED